MRTIKLWAVANGPGLRTVEPLASLTNTETELLLEDVIVQSPGLLMPGLTLVGRQVATAGGPLDLLGVDEDGRLVLFELKRGTLTRDAVAQVLDYASDLAEMGEDQRARLIEDGSGRLGIDKIDNFADWYAERFPSNASALNDAPRMVLVGLDADERARRMTAFLSGAGIEIELLTFHAFDHGGRLLLARHEERVNIVRPPPSGIRRGKEATLHALLQSAATLHVEQPLKDCAEFIQEHLPNAYQSPGQTGFTFSLVERTDQGTKSLRAYVNLLILAEQQNQLRIYFHSRAVQAGGDQVTDSLTKLSAAGFDHRGGFELVFSAPAWPSIRDSIANVLDKINQGWQFKLASSTQPEVDETAE